MAISSNLRPGNRELTLLAIGDVHLGTRPGSLPESLDREGLDPRALTPEAALSIAVDCAIEARVDAVVFAGDVVESTNARFEALRPLESAVRRLLDEGIRVIAVAGNHDVEALPRLARMINGFELIGEGGRWQTCLIENASGAAIEVLGWSFPEKQVRGSPVDSLLRNPIAPKRVGLPRVGLLHCDLDASGGNYAPITSRELAEAGLDAWLLGHIHSPSLGEGKAVAGKAPCGYLGSLVGLDPSERGPHGPWLVTVNSRGEVATQHLPLAPLRWERFEIRVDEDAGPEDLGDRLLTEIERFGREIQTWPGAPKALGVRPVLVGPTRHYDELNRAIHDGRWNGLTRSAGQTLVFIDKLLGRLELAFDLARLARGDDPAALMARKLLILKEPGEERRALLDSARDSLRGLTAELRWSALDQERNAHDPLDDDESVVGMLTKAGTASLSALLAQREIAPVGDS